MKEGRNLASTTLLIAGSALLGATAIAFWNRKTIASLRAKLAEEPAVSAETQGEII